MFHNFRLGRADSFDNHDIFSIFVASNVDNLIFWIFRIFHRSVLQRTGHILAHGRSEVNILGSRLATI